VRTQAQREREGEFHHQDVTGFTGFKVGSSIATVLLSPTLGNGNSVSVYSKGRPQA